LYFAGATLRKVGATEAKNMRARVMEEIDETIL
jgi:hypothetical protein